MGYIDTFPLRPEDFDFLNPIALSEFPVSGYPGWRQAANSIVNTVFSQLSFADIREEAYTEYETALQAIRTGLEEDTIENDAVDFAKAIFAYLNLKYPGRISDTQGETPLEGGERRPEPIIGEEPIETTPSPLTPSTAPERLPELPSPVREPSPAPVEPVEPVGRTPSPAPTEPRQPQDSGGNGGARNEGIEFNSGSSETLTEPLPGEEQGGDSGLDDTEGNGEDGEDTGEGGDNEEPKESDGKISIDYTALENAIFNALYRWSNILASNPPTILTKPADTATITDEDIREEMKAQVENLRSLASDMNEQASETITSKPFSISVPSEE